MECTTDAETNDGALAAGKASDDAALVACPWDELYASDAAGAGAGACVDDDEDDGDSDDADGFD